MRVEQNIQRVLADADPVVLLTAGRLVHCGSSSSLTKRGGLATLLLG